MATLIKYTVGTAVQFINLDHIVTARFCEEYDPGKPGDTNLFMKVTVLVQGANPNLQLTGEDALYAKKALEAACQQTESALRG